MKPGGDVQLLDGRPPFPGLLGRGLIEAQRTGPGPQWARPLSPVYWAGASLKLVQTPLLYIHQDLLSPVYWAGASLKPRLRVRRSRLQDSLSPVYWAGASLKPLAVEAREFALANGLSPVYWAGASLKLMEYGEVGNFRGPFPGLLGRGLIEAETWPARPARSARPFPGLLGRGLIEATSTWTRTGRSWPFPRSTGPGPH